MTLQEIRKRSLEYAKGIHVKPKAPKPSKLSRHPMAAYGIRNALLLKLGFASYKAYLKSELWAKICADKLTKDPKCFGCLCRARQVHHGKYTQENLLGESDKHLYSVCGRCHFSVEFKNKKKVSVNRATRRLKGFRKTSNRAGYEHHLLDEECSARLEREE